MFGYPKEQGRGLALCAAAEDRRGRTVMRELKEDRFYQVIKAYPACVVEYCLLSDEEPYRGMESHRKAVSAAIAAVSASLEEPLEYDIGRASAKRIEAEELFRFPEKPWKHRFQDTVLYENVYEDGKIPYWYAFLEPPCGSGTMIRDGRAVRNEYGKEDFCAVNEALFPCGKEKLTVYEWTTDWSEFFDEGHEWWGAACWSVYDPDLDRYAVILVSSTD